MRSTLYLDSTISIQSPVMAQKEQARADFCASSIHIRFVSLIIEP